MVAEGVKLVRKASPLNMSPTPEIRRAVELKVVATRERTDAGR